jgi:hypothetical protein
VAQGISAKAPNDQTIRDNVNTVVATPQVPRPSFRRGLPIGEYSFAQLLAVILWINSDDVVRTHDEILDIAIKELGYARRGSKIVARLNYVINMSPTVRNVSNT